MAQHHPRNAKRPFFGRKGYCTSREGKVFSGSSLFLVRGGKGVFVR